jgi:signal transduction histidine kinase
MSASPASASPAENAARLAALGRYDVLDTPPEEGFDRITRLVAEWLDVPIALVTLIGEGRQWFKSCVGVDFVETDLERSFCVHNMEPNALLVVEDATRDPRFSDNPLVSGEPGIRFYAGAPLVSPEGYVLGSLCAIDTHPRAAADMHLEVLHDLASLVVDALELRVKNEALRARNRQVRTLTRELQRADESDRSQLSHILQEELQQVLQAARMKLENVRGDAALAASAQDRLSDVAANLDDATDVVRTLLARFAPPVGNQPLRHSLEWLALKMGDDHGLNVSVLGCGGLWTGDESTKTLIYRLVRGLLLRVVRHADTDRARVHLVESTGHLRITVEDEGPGFDPLDEGNGAARFQRMRRQVEELGGHVQVRAHAGSGTCVTIEIPQTAASVSSDGPVRSGLGFTVRADRRPENGEAPDAVSDSAGSSNGEA